MRGAAVLALHLLLVLQSAAAVEYDPLRSVVDADGNHCHIIMHTCACSTQRCDTAL